MTNLNNSYVSNRVLKINVGFLLHGDGGTIRDYDFDLPPVRLAEDVELRYLRGPLRLTRTARGILAQTHMHTGIEAECARCLDRFVLDLDVKIEDLFTFPPTPEAELCVADDGVLDLAPLIRAEVIVHTPMDTLCRPDCRGLCPECGQNLNEGSCKCDRDVIDPRLAILKSLQEKT